MAKMYPTRIPEHIIRDKSRSAEIRIYDLLSQQLSDKFVCYYSRPWHRFTPDGQEKDGEADFVIAHPEMGFLVLEIKGGRVTCREGDEQWLSKDRYGIEYRIKNPVDQARNSKYRLLELLKASKDWKSRFITIRHGVILPDNSRPNRALASDAPLELFAFGDDLNHLDDWVASRFCAVDGSAEQHPLGLDGMEALHRLLSTRFELRPHLARSLSDDMKHIERLTAEQSWILDALEENPQMTVSGAAGTGKTILALEKAMRAATSGKRTLFVCFNVALAFHLKEIAGAQENLIVASFHGLCGTMANIAGIEIEKTQSGDFYARILPEALISAIDKKPELLFDTIVIDEGQDFIDDWLDTLRLCLVDSNAGELYVFHDDNQRIFSSENTFLSALPKSSYRLNRNLRNTRAIHKTLTPWYDSRKVIAAGPDGEEVNWIVTRNQQQAYAKASSIVAELVKTKQLAPSDITVLTGLARERCTLFDKNSIGGCKIVRADESADENYIICDTVRRFKGLEAKCVIIVDIDNLLDDELIYVALSRGSLLLYLVGSEADLSRLRGST